MESGLTAQKIAEHYGYAAVAEKHGCWKNQSGVLEQIRLLPEVLDETKKFRVIIDYDPEFSRTLVQVLENQISTQEQPGGQAGEDGKSSDKLRKNGV